MSGTIQNRSYFVVPFKNESSSQTLQVTINRPINRLCLMQASLLKIDQNIDNDNNIIYVYYDGIEIQNMKKTLQNGLYNAQQFISLFNSAMQNVIIDGVTTNFTLSIDQNTAQSTITMSHQHTKDVVLIGNSFKILGFTIGDPQYYVEYLAGQQLVKSFSSVNFNNTLMCHVQCNYAHNRCSSQYQNILSTILMSQQSNYTYSEYQIQNVENHLVYTTQVLQSGVYTFQFNLLDQDYKSLTVKDSYLIIMAFYRDENYQRTQIEIMQKQQILLQQLVEILSGEHKEHVQHEQDQNNEQERTRQLLVQRDLQRFFKKK